jgi:hypothetical protein
MTYVVGTCNGVQHGQYGLVQDKPLSAQRGRQSQLLGTGIQAHMVEEIISYNATQNYCPAHVTC